MKSSPQVKSKFVSLNFSKQIVGLSWSTCNSLLTLTLMFELSLDRPGLILAKMCEIIERYRNLCISYHIKIGQKHD
jgi:hypothetical protein